MFVLQSLFTHFLSLAAAAKQPQQSAGHHISGEEFGRRKRKRGEPLNRPVASNSFKGIQDQMGLLEYLLT